MQILTGTPAPNVDAVQFTADGRLLVVIASGDPHPIRVWDLASASESLIDGPAEDDSWLATADDGLLSAWRRPDSSSYLFDLGLGRKRRELDPDGRHIARACFAHGGAALVVGTLVAVDGLGFRFPLLPFLKLDCRSGRVLCRWPCSDVGSLDALAVSPDGETVAFGDEAVAGDAVDDDDPSRTRPGFDGTPSRIRLWHRLGEARETGLWICAVDQLAFTPGGKALVARFPSEVAILDAETLAVRRRFRTGRGPLPGNPDFALAPDGRRLAAAGEGDTVRLRNLASGKSLAAFAWGMGRVEALAFAPDGLRAAAACEGGRVVVWDVE